MVHKCKLVRVKKRFSGSANTAIIFNFLFSIFNFQFSSQLLLLLLILLLKLDSIECPHSELGYSYIQIISVLYFSIIL